jgi:rod shape-determining protein MreB
MSKIKKIKDYFSCNLAIDLGTSRTIIIDSERGLVVDQPSVVVVHEKYGMQKIIAVGDEAYKMIGKVPRNHKVIFPLDKGVISDFDVAEKMLLNFMEIALESHPNKIFKPNPKVVVTVPVNATQVEKRSLKELILKTGASHVEIIEQCLAAAIGSELNTNEHSGRLFIHMGYGITEIALISMDDIVLYKTLDVCGNELTLKIMEYFRYSFKVCINKSDAEMIKIKLADLTYKNDESENETLEINVVDMAINVPKKFTVTKKDVNKALIDPCARLIKETVGLLEEASSELNTDILENGIYLTGGGANLHNFDVLLNEVLSIPTTVIENPEYSAVKGCLHYLESI